MAKKKSASVNGETKNKQSRMEDEIIVLNQGQAISVGELKEAEKKQFEGGEEMTEVENVVVGQEEDEEINILGGDVDMEVTIDTTHLDEELGITDVFKDSGVMVLPIGKDKESKGGKDKESKGSKDKESKGSKDKENKIDKKKDKEETKELSKQVLDAFTMILKNKNYEPIPYPFEDNDEAYDLAFEQCVELVDHMVIAKFIRNNPSYSLKDAFKNVFTIADEPVQVTKEETKAEKRKSKELISHEEIKPVCEEVESVDKESNAFSDKVRELFERFEENVASILIEVLKHEDEDAEKVNEVLIKACEEADKENLGKVLKTISGFAYADIVRAEINGDNTLKEKIKTKITKVNERIESNKDSFNEAVSDEMSIDDFIQLLENRLMPDVSKMSLSQIIRERDVIASNMTDSEFAKWVVEIRQERNNNNQEEVKREENTTKMETCEATTTVSHKVNEAILSAKAIINTLAFAN